MCPDIQERGGGRKLTTGFAAGDISTAVASLAVGTAAAARDEQCLSRCTWEQDTDLSEEPLRVWTCKWGDTDADGREKGKCWPEPKNVTIANLNHELLSSRSEQPGLKSGETALRQTKGRRSISGPSREPLNNLRHKRQKTQWDPKMTITQPAIQTRAVFSTLLNTDPPGPPEESDSVLLKWRRYTCSRSAYLSMLLLSSAHHSWLSE